MNLYIRLIWTLLRTWWLPRISIRDPLSRGFRVLPNDLDVNGHMNNGRYLTIIDLMIVEFFARSGFLKVLMKNGWRPMSGGAIISYRRALSPLQKYTVTYRWSGANEHWNFMAFEFRAPDGRLCATGYTKGAAIAKSGLVRNAAAFELLGVPLEESVLPDAVISWMDAERNIMRDLK